MRNRKHFFCFSYSGKDLEGNRECEASSYVGYDTKKVTLQMINENKGYAGVTDKAVLIAVSYLGRMTKATFMGKTK